MNSQILKNIEERISEKKDLLGRNYKYEVINIDKSFPDYILNNKEKYQDGYCNKVFIYSFFFLDIFFQNFSYIYKI